MNDEHPQSEQITEEELKFIEENLKKHMPEQIKTSSTEDQARWYMHVLRNRRRHKEQQELFEAYLTLIEAQYKPHHPHLHSLDGWELEDGVKQLFTKQWDNEEEKKQYVLQLARKETKSIYSFPFLKPTTCTQILEEVEHFETWCKQRGLSVHRPNTMNNYGAILDHFGFMPVLSELTNFINRFSGVLYPHIGDSLDSHHGFIVEYAMDKDIKLDFHVDDSEVTLNLCLGKNFTGGDLYFGGIRCALHQQTHPFQDENVTINHKPGTALLHLGKHRHSATPLRSGHRQNLILWCKSTKYRESENRSACTNWCQAGSDASGEESDEH